jgi:hypothetical protein
VAHSTAGPPDAGRLGSNSRSFRLASSPHYSAGRGRPAGPVSIGKWSSAGSCATT